MQALWLSVVRTIVPTIVGAVLTWLASTGLVIDPEFETVLTAVLFTGFTGVYYIVVRLFETYVSPKFGWLLLAAKSPDHYSKESPVEGPRHRAVD